MTSPTIFETMTDAMIRAIEAGASGDQWIMPWHRVGGAFNPRNATTSSPYRGANWCRLLCTLADDGRAGPWATFKQWQAAGAQVRKGERSVHLMHWHQVPDRRGYGQQEDHNGNAIIEYRYVPSAFYVFDHTQVDGFELPGAAPFEPLDPAARIPDADAWFARVGATVTHGGDRAYYDPAADTITLPDFERFHDAAAYYSTSAHEHAHWTGAAHRLDRLTMTRFGSDAYAAEELIAELSAAMTSALLGTSSEPRPDHAQYLAGWLEVLRADPRHLATIAGAAQAATDHLCALARGETPAPAPAKTTAPPRPPAATPRPAPARPITPKPAPKPAATTTAPQTPAPDLTPALF